MISTWGSDSIAAPVFFSRAAILTPIHAILSFSPSIFANPKNHPVGLVAQNHGQISDASFLVDIRVPQ
jgi:hypothetical protein